MKTDSERIIELFNQASAIAAPEERARFLDDACRDNPEARTQIESLLQAEEPARDFLKPPDVSLTEKPGDRIGRYQLLEKIGEGGGGIVYMAEQEEPVRRRVALKIIKLGMETREVVARFEAERQALAMMDHPSIAKVFDGGATASGRPYFVMELVRGTPLTHYCDEHRLTTRQRLELFVQVCQAVQHAHQKGIIHRDLKPSNVLVTELDGRSTPKVIDFGVAKATEQRLTEKTLFTRFGQLVGTPAYMSPEQAGFGGLDIDTRSDVYSLGVLLYELLTGRPPFDGKKLLEAGYEAILKTIREVEPPKPSTKLSTLSHEELVATANQRNAEPGRLNGLMRGELDWIVMKALEKDRARRYETANGLATDISRHLDNEPVVARPPSRLYRFQKIVQRNRVTFAAAAAVTLVLVIGFAVSTAMYFRAQAEKNKAQTEAAKSQQVARFLTDMLEGVGPSVALGRDTTILKEILDKTAERVGQELINQPGVEVEVRNVLGEVYRSIGAYDQSAAMHCQALSVARRQFGNDHKIVAGCLKNLGATLIDLGKLPDSKAAFREAFDIITSNGETNSLQMAHVLQGLAANCCLNGKMDEAGDLFQHAVAILTGLYGKENGEVAATLMSLANVRHYQGRLEEAESLLQEAFMIQKKLLPPLHPYLADVMANLAALLDHRGKLSQAEELYGKALAIRQMIYGGEHSKIVLLLYNMTDLLQQLGRLDEAEATAHKALAMYRKLPREEPDNIEGGCLKNLALILAEEGKLEEAEKTAREALALWSAQFGDASIEAATGYHTLARVLQNRSKLTEAEEAARKAAALWLKWYPDDNPRFWTCIALGDILLEQKRYADAESQLREGIQGLEPSKTILTLSEKKQLKHALERMVQVCQEMNKPDEAAKWKQKLVEFEAAK